ncbi:MAG: porphobilinogen synthase, partial [Mariprofundaceae bacterium]
MPKFNLAMRPRRLRRTPVLRRMVRETGLTPADLIYPLFIDETIDKPVEVASMPGVQRLPLSSVAKAVREAESLGIPGVILFGIPSEKDAIGSSGWDANGIVQRGIREAKNAAPEMCIITDTCFCEYTDHGHC